MPSIDVAMARSVRGGVGGIIARSLQAAFEDRTPERRDIVSSATSSISSVKESFSSWDNCMEATYCKWPVIALIIIGALIIISIVWCISRCLCCGLSCCCECCHCLKCCGQCCGCCDPPKGRRRKHLDEPYNNIPDSQGYKREDPMAASALPFDRPRPTATTKSEPPQYASFDVSKHADDKEDELPAMPVWGDAESKKIHLEQQQEAMELQQLKPPADANAPLMTGMSPAGTPVPSGAGPYGVPGSQAASSGYLGGAPGSNPYGNTPGQGYGQMHNNAYGQSTTSFHTEQSWGVMPGPGAMPMGQQQEYGQGPGQHPQQQQGYGQPGAYSQEPEGYGDQPGYNDYGANNNMAAAAMNQPQRYGTPPVRSMTGGSTTSMRGPGGYPDRARGSPAPSQQDRFGAGHERAFDPRIMPQRTQSPAPMRASPPQQQGGFDPRGRGSPAQQQGGFDPRGRGSPAQQQGAFADPRSQMPPPQRTASPAQQYGGPPPQQRTYSPAPQQQGPPRGGGYGGPRGPPQQQQQQQQRGGGGLPPRAPPYRQDPAAMRQQYGSNNSPRPGGGGQQRMPPSRSQTVDQMEPPRESRPRDNFSRPMRSNTFDQQQQQQQQQGYGGEQQGGSAYPGYKPYQAGR